MKNFEGLISILKLFEHQWDIHHNQFPAGDRRMQFSEAIAMCFEPCAERILSGHFKVTNNEAGKPVVRTIQPTAIELYYHEEGEGRFKDPIMYHTNDRKVWTKENYFKDRGIEGLPYYPIGSLNPHTSGIDVTFENAKERYRASFLLREYKVSYEGGKTVKVVNSTEIYDDMLLNGITLDKADWIEWCDETEKVEVTRTWRRNVPKYRQVQGEPDRWEPDPNGIDTFSTPKGRVAKCPFNWQFRIK